MPPADLLIRPAAERDLEPVRQLLAETWRDTYVASIGRAKVDELTAKLHAVAVLARQLDMPDTSFLVAERAGILVGHAHGNAQQHGSAIQLGRLYVRPGQQRQGIGAALLAAVIARHPQAIRVRLIVDAANAKGLAFYRRQGFVLEGEAVEDGVRVLRLERVLAP